MDKKLLKAKLAIFKLIAQFHHPTKFHDGELYIYNYCESALESAFEVLGIEDDYISLMNFCRLWEEVDREYRGDEQFNGITADIRYEYMKKDYESWEKAIDYLGKDEIKIKGCDNCNNNGWDMPQCKECKASNGFKYFSRKR